MKNILTINAYGIVTNRSNHAVITNNVGFVGYSTTNSIINTATSGQILVHTGNGNLQFVKPGVQYSMGGPNAAVIHLPESQPKPKYISTLGGTFFKDQKDNIIKYQPVIKGSFTNKSE
jgi:hypothetical protein